MLVDACNSDRAGSGVMETLLRSSDKVVPGVTDLGLKELIVTACWYIWWERRKIIRDESVQKPSRSSQAIMALALNFFRSCKKASGIRRHGWEKPPEGFVKLNIGAAFSVDNFTGAVVSLISEMHLALRRGRCEMA